MAFDREQWEVRQQPDQDDSMLMSQIYRCLDCGAMNSHNYGCHECRSTNLEPVERSKPYRVIREQEERKRQAAFDRDKWQDRENVEQTIDQQSIAGMCPQCGSNNILEDRKHLPAINCFDCRQRTYGYDDYETMKVRSLSDREYEDMTERKGLLFSRDPLHLAHQPIDVKDIGDRGILDRGSDGMKGVAHRQGNVKGIERVSSFRSPEEAVHDRGNWNRIPKPLGTHSSSNGTPMGSRENGTPSSGTIAGFDREKWEQRLDQGKNENHIAPCPQCWSLNVWRKFSEDPIDDPQRPFTFCFDCNTVSDEQGEVERTMTPEKAEQFRERAEAEGFRFSSGTPRVPRKIGTPGMERSSMAMNQFDFEDMSKVNPYMYHWTEPDKVDSILAEGLRPFDDGQGHRWDSYLTPRPGHVYMMGKNPSMDESYDWKNQWTGDDGTYEGVYPPEGTVPIRIDLSKIDPANLTADEDHASGLSFMEEGPSFMEEGLEDPSNSDSLGQWAEDNAAYVDDPERAWSSLTGLNSLAHRGMIPAEALSRDPEWDYDQRYEKWTHVSAFNRDKWKNSGVDDTLDDEQSGGECYYAAMSLADQYPELEYRAGYYYAPDRRYPEGREEPHAWVVDKEGRIYDNTHSQFDPNFPVVRGEDPSSELGRRYKSWTDHSGLPDGWLEDIPDPYDPMKALGPDYQHSDICANCGEKERSLGLLWCDDCIESLKESSVPEGHYPCPACNKSEIEVLSLDGMKTQFVCPTCGWKGGPEVLEPIRAYAAFDRLRWEQRSGQPSNNVPLVNDGRKIDPQGAGICPNCRGNALVMPKQNLVWCPECKRSIKDGIVGFDLDEYQAEYAQGKIDWALKPKASGVYRSDLEGFVDVDWKIRMGAFDKTEWERRQPPPGDPNEIQLWDKDGSSITRCPGCGSQALLERTSPDSEGTIACGECEGWYHADGSFADGLPKHIVDDIMRPLQKRQAMSLPQGDWQQSDYDLLHWTKPENVASMLTGGIVPWDEHPEDLGKSRYESDEFQTRPGYVYMGTQGYQPINPEEKLVPVRVDHRQLDPEDFEADEDWMKMMYENTDPEYEPDDPVWEYQPTAPSSHGNLGDWANANAEMMNDPEYTFHSYSAGSVAHRGMIPPSALSLVDGHEYPPEAYEVNPVHPDQQELFDRKVAAFDRGKWEQRQDLGSGGGSKQMNLTYIGVCPNGHDAVRQQNLASCPECGTFFDMEKGSSLKMLRSEVRSAQRRMEELRRSSAFNPDWWRKRQDHVEPPQENSLQWELGRNPGEIPEYKGLEAEYFCQNCGGDSVIGYWDDDGELKCGDCDHEWLRDQDVTLWKKRGAFDRSDWERPEQGMRLWGEERPECPLCHGFNTYQAESHSRLACFDCQMEIETAYPDLGIKTWAMTDWVEDSDNQVGRDFWEQRRQEQEFNDEQDLLGRPKLPREGGFDRKRWEERKPTPDPLDDPKQIFDPNAAFGPTHSLDKILLCPNCGSDKEVLVQAPGLGTKADDLVCGLCRYEWSKAEEGLKNYWRPADWS